MVLVVTITGRRDNPTCILYYIIMIYDILRYHNMYIKHITAIVLCLIICCTVCFSLCMYLYIYICMISNVSYLSRISHHVVIFFAAYLCPFDLETSDVGFWFLPLPTILALK